nr:hypothetical protein BaRGS_027747 [Batillaria attramentaria]
MCSGVLAAAHRYRTLGGRSVLDCVAQCRPDSGCLSVVFDSSSHHCNLGAATVTLDCRNTEPADLHMEQYETDGVYDVCPLAADQPFSVYCKRLNHARTYVMVRTDDRQDFNKNFLEYTEGFGSLAGDHWLGLERGGVWFRGDTCSTCNPTGPLTLPADGLRYGVDNEAFWTVNLGDLVPFKVTIFLAVV